MKAPIRIEYWETKGGWYTRSRFTSNGGKWQTSQRYASKRNALNPVKKIAAEFSRLSGGWIKIEIVRVDK